MDKELIEKVNEIDAEIQNLVKQRNKFEEMMHAESIKETDTFFENLIGKCFSSREHPTHFYLPLKYFGYDSMEHFFVFYCRDLYFDGDYIMYRTLKLHFTSIRDFNRTYNIHEKDKFVDAVMKVTNEMITSLS